MRCPPVPSPHLARLHRVSHLNQSGQLLLHGDLEQNAQRQSVGSSRTTVFWQPLHIFIILYSFNNFSTMFCIVLWHTMTTCCWHLLAMKKKKSSVEWTSQHWANTSVKSGQNCGKEGCKWLKWNNFSNPSLPVLEKKLHPRLSEAPNQQDIPYTHFSRNEKGSSPCHAPNAHTCARSFGDLRQPFARVVQDGAAAASLARGYKPFVQPLYSLGALGE